MARWDPGFCAGTAGGLQKVPLMDPRRTRAREACLCACRTVGPPARATSGNMSGSMSGCSHPNCGCKCATQRGSGRALPSSARHIHVTRPSYNTHDRRSKAAQQGLTWWFSVERAVVATGRRQVAAFSGVNWYCPENILDDIFSTAVNPQTL